MRELYRLLPTLFLNASRTDPAILFLEGVQATVSWQSPLTTTHSRKLSKSRIRAVQCYDCPTRRCGSGHNTW